MGTTASKEVTFELVSSTKHFCIRRYSAAVIAEVVSLDNYVPDVDDSLQALTEYFGIRSQPKNAEELIMPMTIPYLLTINDKRKVQQVAETKDEEKKSSAEMVAEEQPATKETGAQNLKPSILTCNLGYVSFYLPPEIADPKDAPRSYDRRIEVKQLPARIVGVRTFCGHFSKKHVTKEAAKLFADLVANGYLADEPNNGSFSYTLAHYSLGRAFGNMDKLGSMVRHEIWVTLPNDNPNVITAIAAFEANQAALTGSKPVGSGDGDGGKASEEAQGKASGDAQGESSGGASSESGAAPALGSTVI